MKQYMNNVMNKWSTGIDKGLQLKTKYQRQFIYLCKSTMKKLRRKMTIDNVTYFINHSKLMDIISVSMIIFVGILSGYLFETLNTVTHMGGLIGLIPFGIISIFDSSLSIMSTRLTTRFSNLGNIISIPEIILGATIDYILGNQAAPLTYSISFIIYLVAIFNWNKHQENQPKKPIQGIKGMIMMVSILILALSFSGYVNLIGYGYDINAQNIMLFTLSTLVFGLSLVANILNAFKFSLQWNYWLIYDVVQLFKAISQYNVGNIIKYISYIIMGLSALYEWKMKEYKDALMQFIFKLKTI